MRFFLQVLAFLFRFFLFLLLFLLFPILCTIFCWRFTVLDSLTVNLAVIYATFFFYCFCCCSSLPVGHMIIQHVLYPPLPPSPSLAFPCFYCGFWKNMTAFGSGSGVVGGVLQYSRGVNGFARAGYNFFVLLLTVFHLFSCFFFFFFSFCTCGYCFIILILLLLLL